MIKLVKLRRVAILLLAPGVLALTGCNDRESEAAEAAAIASAQLEAGNLVDAKQSIQRAIIARDDVADYFILLGRIHLAAGEPSGAFNAYSRALDLQADNLEILQNIAELGLATDRLSEADEAASRMLLLFPGSTRAMLVKGFIAIDKGQLDVARKFGDDILAINAADQGGAILSARVSAIQGRFDEAAQEIESARGSSLDAEALDATLLEIYRAQGNVKGLREVFPKVVAVAPKGTTQYHLDYINFLYKIGAVQAARAEASKVIANGPNDIRSLSGLTRLFHEYDREPLTNAQIEALAQAGTRTTQVILARYYLETRQLNVALNITRRPVGEGVVEAQGLVSRVLLASGKSADAQRMAEQVLRLDPRNFDALLTRSAIRLASGEVDRALEDANIVVSDAPEEYAGYVALAKAQMAKGSQVRARQVYERGIDVLPQSAPLAAEYRAFLRQIGSPTRVMSLYGDFAAASPSSLMAARLYLAVCEEANDPVCLIKAQRAVDQAKRSFLIDDAPGAPKNRGLFSRITPEQICRASGGVCTAS